jgi:hypothetical protein
MRGITPRNLKYMRAIADSRLARAIVQEVLAQITWTHSIALIEEGGMGRSTRYRYREADQS